MIYYLFIMILCISTTTSFCADPRRNPAEAMFPWMKELTGTSNTVISPEQKDQNDILKLVKTTIGCCMLNRYQYSLTNNNGLIIETRINPKTALTEQRSFTPADVAHVSFDTPGLIADIILKQ